MEPKTGPRFPHRRTDLSGVRDSYADLLKAIEGADLLVTHPRAPAGPLVARKTGIPWVSTVLAPFSFYSSYDPPVPPFWQWTRKLSLLGPGVMGFFLGVMKNTYKAKAVTDFRKELGPRRHRQSDVRRPALTHTRARFVFKLFGQRQPDWPPQTEITGFCFTTAITTSRFRSSSRAFSTTARHRSSSRWVRRRCGSRVISFRKALKQQRASASGACC